MAHGQERHVRDMRPGYRRYQQGPVPGNTRTRDPAHFAFEQNPATPRRSMGLHTSNRFSKSLLRLEEIPVVLEFNSSLVEELQRSDIDPDVDLSEHLEHLPFSCFFISAEHLGFRLSNADGKLKHAVGFFLDYAWMPRSDQPHRVRKTFS